MARKVESYRAHAPQKFRLPGIPKKSSFADKFQATEPRPKQAEVDPEFTSRFNSWRASSPAYQAGSVPEFIVWEYLTRKKQWHDGAEFKYQYDLLGGRTRYGGFVVDYYIRTGNMAWNIQGLKYHLEKSRDRAKVQVQDALLSQRGYRVLSLWEDDLIERPVYTIEAALRGQATNRHSDDVGFL